MSEDRYGGILFIGDPHLASRAPGFRKDDYPRAAMGKLRFALGYAREHRLLPALLGDLFHWPRDNANWLLVELMELLDGSALTVVGNHDCTENALCPNDSLSILLAAGKLRPIDGERPWVGEINGEKVMIGGTTWGEALPERVERAAWGDPRVVFWLTHHDLRFPGNEVAAKLDCREIPGVDAVINGHIHRVFRDVQAGGTRWMNPGSLCRTTREWAMRGHEPGVLHVEVNAEGWNVRRVGVPHEPFEAVFHPMEEGAGVSDQESLFIQGLKELQSFKTAGGAGLRQFLEQNLAQYPAAVAEEIRVLMREVLHDGQG